MLNHLATTVEDYIKSGRDVALSYKSFSFLEAISNGTIASVHDVVNDYIDELRQLSVPVKLTDEQYRKYVYKPKLLCYDTYGNAELYFIILLINDMADVKEFNKKIIYMLEKDTMSTIASYIYNSEHKDIKKYNTRKEAYC